MKSFGEWLNNRDGQYFDETFRKIGGGRPLFNRQPGTGLFGLRRPRVQAPSYRGGYQSSGGGTDDSMAQRSIDPATGTFSPGQQPQLATGAGAGAVDRSQLNNYLDPITGKLRTDIDISSDPDYGTRNPGRFTVDILANNSLSKTQKETSMGQHIKMAGGLDSLPKEAVGNILDGIEAGLISANGIGLSPSDFNKVLQKGNFPLGSRDILNNLARQQGNNPTSNKPFNSGLYQFQPSQNSYDRN